MDMLNKITTPSKDGSSKHGDKAPTPEKKDRKGVN